MFSRSEPDVSEKMMRWLSKTKTERLSKQVKYSEAFVNACLDIENQIRKAVVEEGTAISAKRDDFDEVVIRVVLAKSALLGTTELLTKVYVITNTPWIFGKTRKTVIALEDGKNIKTLRRIPKKELLSINGGQYVETLDTIEEEVFKVYI